MMLLDDRSLVRRDAGSGDERTATMRRPHTDQNRGDQTSEGFALKAPRPFPEGAHREDVDTEGHLHIRVRTEGRVVETAPETEDQPKD
jgi:hypothetical protein